MLTRNTNDDAIMRQYLTCTAPPELEWKFGPAAMELFSNPGYFFKQWEAVELKRQEEAKKLRKQEKAAKKRKRKEDKKRRMEQRESARARGDSLSLRERAEQRESNRVKEELEKHRNSNKARPGSVNSGRTDGAQKGKERDSVKKPSTPTYTACRNHSNQETR